MGLVSHALYKGKYQFQPDCLYPSVSNLRDKVCLSTSTQNIPGARKKYLLKQYFLYCVLAVVFNIMHDKVLYSVLSQEFLKKERRNIRNIDLGI